MASQEPLLLTPGPLTTSRRVRAAMSRDWGSRDQDFIELNADIRRRLVGLIDGGDAFTAIPLQGSGSFIVEATLGTLVPKTGKLLVMNNGAYGARMMTMARYHGRDCVSIDGPEDQPNDVDALAAALRDDPAISHVAAVYCETTSGILNDIESMAKAVAAHGRSFMIDAMSAFGALPLSAKDIAFDAVMASSNKCLEGVPGMGFALVRKSVIAQAQGNAPALVLDLAEQVKAMDKNGQWRFTPPTHVMAAFREAMIAHEEEGGVAGRGARYRENCAILCDGMAKLGFTQLLPPALQAPIIVTFKEPDDPAFEFNRFYDGLRARGFAIYPGKLTVAPSFRIGCIGHLGADEMHAALAAVRDVMSDMGLKLAA